MRSKKRRTRSKYTYSVYKRLYKQAEQRLKKAGFEMFDKQGMLSRQEFWDEYRSNTLKNKSLPKEKQSRNITRDIVSSQTYSVSQSYAKHLKKGLYNYYKDQFGEEYAKKKLKSEKVTIHNIRVGAIDFDVLADEDVIAGYFDPTSS